MYSHHVGSPRLAERIARHATALEAIQRAHEPYLVAAEDTRRIARERHPRRLIGRHNVSLRHMTSRDVSYRFRR